MAKKNSERQSRTKKKTPTRRRNPDESVERDGEGDGRRRRNPSPKTTVAELAAAAGLVRSDGRPLTEVATWFLKAMELGVRWHSQTGEALVLAAEASRAADALAVLHEAGICLAREDYRMGCPAPAMRRNPFIGIHVNDGGAEDEFQADLAEMEDLDYIDDCED